MQGEHGQCLVEVKIVCLCARFAKECVLAVGADSIPPVKSINKPGENPKYTFMIWFKLMLWLCSGSSGCRWK